MRYFILLALVACATKAPVVKAKPDIEYWLLDGETGTLLGQDTEGLEDHSSVTCGQTEVCYVLKDQDFKALMKYQADVEIDLNECQRNSR
jgi:hypothetical protein